MDQIFERDENNNPGFDDFRHTADMRAQLMRAQGKVALDSEDKCKSCEQELQQAAPGCEAKGARRRGRTYVPSNHVRTKREEKIAQDGQHGNAVKNASFARQPVMFTRREILSPTGLRSSSISVKTMNFKPTPAVSLGSKLSEVRAFETEISVPL